MILAILLFTEMWQAWFGSNLIWKTRSFDIRTDKI